MPFAGAALNLTLPLALRANVFNAECGWRVVKQGRIANETAVAALVFLCPAQKVFTAFAQQAIGFCGHRIEECAFVVEPDDFAWQRSGVLLNVRRDVNLLRRSQLQLLDEGGFVANGLNAMILGSRDGFELALNRSQECLAHFPSAIVFVVARRGSGAGDVPMLRANSMGTVLLMWLFDVLMHGM
ncbi:hypothetical protein [Diaphorobacter caeni]|uniref:hypothetical protein n=1 Tax=Diaphorobacter caeni TaxID=2784387 RepID=UPI00188ED104|nr:hypothetical protein [Diaphorobacter caeni]MBF5006541.1 hypothetical protein [Diaphorobacter caeni]